MSNFNVHNVSTSEMVAIRAAAHIASAIAANPNGGSILLDGLDHYDREAVIETPKSGIAVSFDKTTEKRLGDQDGIFLMFSVADWILRTRYLVGPKALRDAIVKGAKGETKYECDHDTAYRYLDAGLCVGWWKDGNDIVLDWSVVFPHTAIAHAAACAIGAQQQAVYVVDTQTVVNVEEDTVKGVGFDIIAKAGLSARNFAAPIK